MNASDVPVPRVIGPDDVDPSDWERQLLARIVARDTDALLELRDRFGVSVFDRVRLLTGDRLVASLVTCGVFAHVWRNPAGFAGHDLRASLLCIAVSRAREWLASTDNSGAIGLAGVTWPHCPVR